MRLLVISDLHICNGDSFGTFGWSDKDFIKVLKKIIKKNKVDQVILNGDIYELYKYEYEDIKKQHKDIIKYFKKLKCIYICGNHDFLCDHGVTHYTIENTQGQKIHIEHGHKADFMNGTLLGRFIVYLFFKFMKFAMRFQCIHRIYFGFMEKDEELVSPRRYDSYKYLRYAMKLLKEYDVVILGHTHRIEAHKTYRMHHKKRYLNSGSCSFGRFQGVLLDTESLRYETFKLDKVEVI